MILWNSTHEIHPIKVVLTAIAALVPCRSNWIGINEIRPDFQFLMDKI